MDVVDNQIETTHTKPLDRKKRDLDEVGETTLESTVTDQDENGSNDRIDRGGGVRRDVRQLRPPPIGQSSWQYNNNYEVTNIHHEPHSSGSERGFARDQGVSYNPFLVPPGTRANQFFKNGGSNEFFHLSQFGNSYAPGKGAQSNAVTEFNSHKPFTVHTSFDVDDAQAQYNGKRPNKEGFATGNPFYPLVSQKPSPPVRAAADNLPDNFSYYHIGNTGGKTERDVFQNRPAPQPQQQQQAPRLPPQPQAPIYYLNKPVKLLSASTPKNHYIQFSTVGGFFNNNPTAFSPIDNHKKQKLRPSTEKYDLVTHRPIYREPAAAPVHEPDINDNSHYEIHDVGQPYPRPTTAPRLTSTPSNPFYDNDNQNEKDLPAKLYTYHVTTEEVKIPLPNKNKGFFITPNTQKHNEADVKLITPKPHFGVSAFIPEKSHPTSKRPIGLDSASKFIDGNRDSQRTQLSKPKQPLHTQPLPNDFGQPNKLSTSTAQNFNAETTSLADADDYYYYDNDEDTKTTTVKSRPIQVDQTTYRIDQRYTPNTAKTMTSTSAKVPTFPRLNKFELKPRPPKIQPLTQEYFEYDDDEEYEDDVNEGGNEFQFKLPPVNVSKFMPMSETAAPRPAYMVTTTSRPKLSSTTTHKYTTSPYTKSHATKQHSHAPSAVPAIIKFPGDIFQAVRPMHELDSNATRYLKQTTLRPYTIRPRNKTANFPPKNYPLMTKIPLTRTTTETTTPTTTVTVGKTHRPYTKTRGQDNSNLNRFAKPSKRPNSLKKHLWELDERLPNRYMCTLYHYPLFMLTTNMRHSHAKQEREKHIEHDETISYHSIDRQLTCTN